MRTSFRRGLLSTLAAAGLVQGYLWANLSHWAQSILASAPFWWTRSLAGLIIVAGQALFLWELWATARAPLARPVFAPVVEAA